MFQKSPLEKCCKIPLAGIYTGFVSPFPSRLTVSMRVDLHFLWFLREEKYLEGHLPCVERARENQKSAAFPMLESHWACVCSRSPCNTGCVFLYMGKHIAEAPSSGTPEVGLLFQRFTLRNGNILKNDQPRASQEMRVQWAAFPCLSLEQDIQGHQSSLVATCSSLVN